MAISQNIPTESYRDLSATKAKAIFGELLDTALQGEHVRIARRGRGTQRVVMLSEADYDALKTRIQSPLTALESEFDQMMEQMQTTQSKQAVDSLSQASMTELAQAAKNNYKQHG